MASRTALIQGLRELCDRQQPGEEVSLNRIAETCRCTPQRVGQIERDALIKLHLGMYRRHGAFMREYFPSRLPTFAKQ